MPSAAGRRVGMGLVIGAPVPFAIGVVASADPSRYVYLEHPYLAVTVSVGMLAAAGQLTLRRRALRVGAHWLAAVLATMALLTGFVRSLPGPFEPVRGPVVASSPDYRVVAYEVMGAVAALRVQSRAGLLSREGRSDVACFSWSSSDSAPGDLFNRVAFVGSNEIEVVTEDGQAARVRFDPQTLTPEALLDRCGRSAE